MSVFRLSLITVMAMTAFAGNSILCRLALATTAIDAASFTTLRLASGAVMLSLLVRFREGRFQLAGNWLSALALFVYAAGFSFAYLSLTTATGALLLFSAVQATMIVYALYRGERFNTGKITGICLAAAGFIILILPGLEAPPFRGATLMVAAGVAWGCYSLRGSGAGHPTRETAGNFLRAAPLGILVSLILLRDSSLDRTGVALAVGSGAIASGLGYALWYTVLPLIRASTAATVQLSVPALAALGGVLLLGEPLTLRLVVSALATFAGIALFSLQRSSKG